MTARPSVERRIYAPPVEELQSGARGAGTLERRPQPIVDAALAEVQAFSR